MSSLLWISALSPLFFYSPSPAYFATTNQTAAWAPQANPIPSSSPGNDSIQLTSGPAGVVLPSVYLTSYTPLFTNPQNFYSVSVGEKANLTTSWTSGQAWVNDQFASRTIQMNVECNTTHCSSGELGFYGAWIETQLTPPGSEGSNVTIDDSSSAITYQGFASLASTGGSASLAPSGEDFNNTLSSTSTSDASASVTFVGSSIEIFGLTTPTSGTYQITLDNTTVGTYNANFNVTSHSVHLYFATDLSTGIPHELVISAKAGAGGEVGLILDRFTVYGPVGGVGFIENNNGGVVTTITSGLGPSSTPNPNANATGVGGPVPSVVPPTNTTTPGGIPANATGAGTPNAGVIIGAILGTLIGLAIIGFLFRKAAMRLEGPKKKLDPWDQANLLQNQKNEEVHVTTAANQRYVYPGLIAHSELKRFP